MTRAYRKRARDSKPNPRCPVCGTRARHYTFTFPGIPDGLAGIYCPRCEPEFENPDYLRAVLLAKVAL